MRLLAQNIFDEFPWGLFYAKTVMPNLIKCFGQIKKIKKKKNKKIPLTSNDRFASCLVMSGVTEMN